MAVKGNGLFALITPDFNGPAWGLGAAQVGGLIVVVAGALFMINGKISPADLTAYLLYVSTLLATLRTIIQFTEQFQRGMTGIERFLEIMDAPAEITEKENADELKNVQGNITFENVGFHYSDDDTNVLSNINLNIKKGNSVALVGPSGGGKTTLCNLIPRFYDATQGTIKVDGVDVRHYDHETLHNIVGYIPQKAVLFSGDITSNMTMGTSNNSPLDDAKIWEALELAQGKDFVENKEGQLKAEVAQAGSNFSGGQKQRAAVARALITNPKLILADEPTGALDSKAASALLSVFGEINAEGQTILMVTHSAQAASHASRVLFIKDGEVFHQIYKGSKSCQEMYQMIADTLTILTTGGEQHA